MNRTVTKCGQHFSFSNNAVNIRFEGGPWNGQTGLYDHDHNNLTIVCMEDHIQYDYTREGPGHFKARCAWINGVRYLPQ